MSRVTLFTKNCCSLCDSAKFIIHKVALKTSFRYEEVDISSVGNEKWNEMYKNDIPVIHINGIEKFRHRIAERELLRELNTPISST